MAELCAWKNMLEGAGRDLCMENVADGCWLRCVYFFGGREGVGHSFAYVAHFVFLRGA